MKINAAKNATMNRFIKLDLVPHDPTAEDLRRQRLYCEHDQIGTSIYQRHQNSQLRAPACAASRDKFCAKQRQKECHHDVTKNQPREVGFGSQKRWDFLMRAMHEHPVPEESKEEEKT